MNSGTEASQETSYDWFICISPVHIATSHRRLFSSAVAPYVNNIHPGYIESYLNCVEADAEDGLLLVAIATDESWEQLLDLRDQIVEGGDSFMNAGDYRQGSHQNKHQHTADVKLTYVTCKLM